MRRIGSAGLLALLLSIPPYAVWAAGVFAKPVIAAPASVAASLPALPLGLQTSPTFGATLQAPVLLAAPAVLSPRQALAQTAIAASQALRAAAPEVSARAAASVFDQAAAAPVEAALAGAAPAQLQVDGIERRWGKLYRGGRRLESLGSGSFGVVYKHPALPGAVIKMMTVFSSQAALEEAQKDQKVAAALQKAGVGPRVLGIASVPGKAGRLIKWLWSRLGIADSPVVIKERVYGQNVEQLMQQGRFSLEDYELIERMLERMADARIRVGDLRTSNIMIGTTAADPTPRAYLIDGGWLLKVKESESREDLLRSLKFQQTQCLGGGGTAAWGDNYLNPFDDILRAGLARPRGR